MNNTILIPVFIGIIALMFIGLTVSDFVEANKRRKRHERRRNP